MSKILKIFFVVLYNPFITWPYLWSNPMINFFEIFSSLNKVQLM